MQTELVRVTTADSIRLDGALNRSTGEHPRVDALICLHGVASTFYGSSLFESLVPPLVDAGITMLRINTRGHDSVFPASGGRRLGAAYERIHEGTVDIDAWWSYLSDLGHSRIGVLGHSLGAIKGVFHQSQDGGERAACLLALSPPRLSHLAFRNGEASAVYSMNLREAERRVTAGEGSALMEATFPFPLLITADGYIDKYGPGERYNIVELAPRLKCPTLFTYGERELGGPAFAGVPQALHSANDGLTIETITDADHLYTGVHEPLATCLVDWLAR